jgi:hypothetical protein
MSATSSSPDWQRLLAAQRRLQTLVPGAVLVGGTAAALHLRHRTSLDGDHVLPDLQDRFDDVLARLEATPGWETVRIRPPVLILGSLDGVPTGIRQLRRQRALETVSIEGLRAPSLVEMARVKAWLLVERNTVRDYVDTVALLERVGEAGLAGFARTFASSYGRGPQAGPVLVELVEVLRAASPADAAAVDLRTYKDVIAPWNDLEEVRRRGAVLAAKLAGIALSGPDGGARA